MIRSNFSRLLCCTTALFAVMIMNAQPDPYPSNTVVNFVRTFEATAPEANHTNLIARPLKDVKQATQYIDGVGRPLQSVIKEGSLETGSTPNDIISPVMYDVFSREQYKYTSFPANNTGGYPTNDGLFKLNPFAQQNVFMTAQYGGQGESNFYSKTNFETAPLSRVEKSMAPGVNWTGSNRGVEMKYWLNTPGDAAIKIWTVTNGAAGAFSLYAVSGDYAAGELFKNVSVDEHNKQVIEVKDKEGRVILKKVQLTATADNGTGSVYTGWLCTYYIYDNLGNLRCVIQPKAVEGMAGAGNWTLDANTLAEQCFRYEYDARNRMIMKKVPGAEPVYMVYDKRDRLVMTRDGNMATAGKWIVTVYDDMNRSIQSGLWTNNDSWVTHSGNAANTGNPYYYPFNESSIPGSGWEMLTKTHYDDYLGGLPAGLSATYLNTWDGYFSATNPGTWPYPVMPVQNNATRSMVTWSQVKILGSNPAVYLGTVSIYDDKGRVIQIQSNNIAGGTDVITTQYSWSGQPLVTVQKQSIAGTNAQTSVVVTQMTYDDLGRVIKTEKKVSNTFVIVNGIAGGMPAYKTIVQNEYDKLGQLKKKKLGSNNLETLIYEYNIRGWMLGMNRDYAKDLNNTNYFGFDLGYDKANNNIIGGQTYTNPQYNGNIEGMVWKSRGDGEKRKYDFAYDAANRLMKADFKQYTSGTFNQAALADFSVKMGDGADPNLAYDANGNIKQMQQWGLKIFSSDQIDNLVYTYQGGSNKLAKVTDGVVADNKLGDFKDGINTNDDYSYDANGNLVTDQNKKILDIQYNYLNLPEVITVELPVPNPPYTTRNITYTYDAAGNKLRKTVLEQPGLDAWSETTTTYINGFIYESKSQGMANPVFYSDVLQFTGHEEGRIRFKPVAGAIPASLQYDYMLKDHLGNVRAVLTEEQQQDIYPAATLENTIVNGGTAFDTESQFYTINAANIVLQTDAQGIAVYQNNNGNPPYNNSPYSNTTANSAKLYKLNATVNTVNNKTGLGIVLKVMAGDVVNIFGKSYHRRPSGGVYSSPTTDILVSELINAFAGTGVAGTKGVTGSQITGQSGFPATVNGLTGTQPAQSNNQPRAAINWIVFDEQFKYISGGFDMVGSDDNGTGVLKSHNLTTIPIPKNGYIYVYCSNESKYNVFFDNLQVIHDRGPILEETHYYPFGLTMSGISSKALAFGDPKNRKGYAGNEIQDKEFSDGSGLDLYDFNARTYYHQIGRFIQIDPLSEEADQEGWSPYHYSYDNPITYSDPDGKCPCLIIPIIQAIAAAVAAGTTTYVVVKSYENADLDLNLNLSLPAATGTGTARPAMAGSAAQMDAAVERQIRSNSTPAPVIGTSLTTSTNVAGSTANKLAQAVKARSASDQKLIDEAKQQKTKEDASKTRAQQRQQQSADGKAKEGTSNQGTKGSHNSGNQSSADKQKHDKAEARRAKEQAAADKKKEETKKN
jgi:RHS repeat-associated protein